MAKDRELVEPNPGDKRYVRRDNQGRFTKDQVDVGKSISQDMQRESKTKVKKGQGDQGDQGDLKPKGR